MLLFATLHYSVQLTHFFCISGAARSMESLNLNQYRWQNRIIVTYANSDQNSKLSKLRQDIQENSCGFKNRNLLHFHITGKSLSEALFLGSTNPHYDKRLFIDLPVHYMKTTSSEHGENILCAKIVLNVKTKTKNNLCTQHVLSL